MLADESYLRTDGKTPKLGKTGCRKLTNFVFKHVFYGMMCMAFLNLSKLLPDVRNSILPF